MKKIFLSFADTWRKSGKRIAKEAHEMGVFDEVCVLSQKDLPATFRKKFNVTPLVRGCGYWAWKPYIILRKLEEMSEGDILVYCDAGCHLNVRGRERLEAYFEKLQSAPLGVLVVEERYSEREWTKGDVFDYFNVRNKMSIVNSPQIRSAHFIVIKSAASFGLVEEWLQVYNDDFSIADDSPSRSSNLEGFKENRHDQSILSVLCKLHQVDALPASETLPLSDPNTGLLDWSTMERKPIWDVRHREIPFFYKFVLKSNDLLHGKKPKVSLRKVFRRLIGMEKTEWKR